MVLRTLALLPVAIALVTGAPQTPVAQLPATTGSAGNALVAGRVVDASTGGAMTGVVVTLTKSAGPASTVLVDSRGRFAFANVPAGRIAIRSEKPGYMSGGIGRTRADGPTQPLDLRDGERLTDLQILMWRRSSIEGTVVDERGEPVVGVPVLVLLRGWSAGRPSWSRFTGDAVTDDRGIYHFGQAWPGDYVVAVSSRVDSFPMSFVEAEAAARQVPPAQRQDRTAELSTKGSNQMGVTPSSASLELDGYRVSQADARDGALRVENRRLWIYPFTFHPAARTFEAATIVHLDAGQQRKGVDIRLTLSPTARVSGVASGPDGPIANLALRLRLTARNDVRVPDSNIAETVTDGRGAFTFFGVPAGQYVISAVTTATAQTAALWAAQPITTTERDQADVAVTLQPALRVSGRVEFDGTSTRPTPQQLGALLLAMDPTDGAGPRRTLNIDPDGNFRSVNVMPGQYFIRMIGTSAPIGGTSAAAGLPWTMKSATVNARDVADTPLTLDADVDGVVVTFTDRPASLRGTVRTAQGATDPAAAVILFPVDAALWTNSGASPRRLRNLRTDRAGTFMATNLPAGDYFVVAVADAVSGQWQDPKFLETAARLATRTRIDDGQASTIELRTQRW